MKHTREHWGSRLGFVLAAAGSAIGLGSLWKFPYATGQNGGGVFVLLYLVFTFLISLPLFIAELVIGRHAQQSAVGAFMKLSKGSQNWKLLGWLNLLTAFVILSFYSVVAGWCLNYVFMSLSSFTAGKSATEIKDIFNVMLASPGINLFWFFLFTLLNIGVVFAGVKKGIEHWAKILTPALFVILLGLFAYSCTLSGFPDAVKFIFKPDFTKLTPAGVLEALGLAFFTLSVGVGVILTYGSYMQPSEDLPKTGLIVSFMTISISLIGALMIFPIIFTFGMSAQEGPGLVFQTLPVLFEQLPGTQILSTVFFVLFVFTALTSSISLLEVVVANLMEIFSMRRVTAVLVGGFASYVLGIPSALAGSGVIFKDWPTLYGGKNFFDTLNYLTTSWSMPLGALLTAIFIGWYYDKKVSQDEYLSGTTLGKSVKLWFWMVRWIVPIGILLVLLEESGVVKISKLLSSIGG